MAKFEHQTPDKTLTHAAVVGHLLRGTVVEGKDYRDALGDAYDAVGEASDVLRRRQLQDRTLVNTTRFQRSGEPFVMESGETGPGLTHTSPTDYSVGRPAGRLRRPS